MDFYTNVQVYGGRILYRGVCNGKRVKQRYDFAPSLYLPSQTPTEFRTMSGQYLQEMPFKNIRAAKDFIYTYNDVDQAIYGMRRFEYSFIKQNPPKDWRADHVQVARIDIEVESENGFPDPAVATEVINLISYKMNGKIFSFGLGDYTPERDDVFYSKCDDEKVLLSRFIAFWQHNHPDIVTGWFIAEFDIPYLVNRIKKVLGEEEANKLSPWGVLKAKKREETFRETYSILGISVMDSIDLYKKYCPHGMSQDSYKLDNIAKLELGEGKLDYSATAGSLKQLYKSDWKKYVDYNIRDIEADEGVANKYKVIELALTVAYMNLVNYDDVFMQVRMWAAIVDSAYGELGIKLDHGKQFARYDYSGGYVRQPEADAYEDVVSEDLTSLYPHLFMQFNVSPETLVQPHEYTDEMREFLNQNITVDRLLEGKIDTSKLKEWNMTVTPNGQLFRTDFQGVIPKIMETMFMERDRNKKKQIEVEKQIEHASKEDREALEFEAARYKSLQMALKVCLNSAYGATGSNYFVLYDPRLAEGITSAGRLAIQWIGNKTNDYLQSVLGTTKNYIIAQDTDSMYIHLNDLVKTAFGDREPTIIERVEFMDKVCKGPLNDVINKGFEELKVYTNAFAQKMFMKREAIATRAFWTGKKRYAMAIWDNEGVRYEEVHIKIVGLEAKRSSTPPRQRKAIKKLCKIILTEDRKATQGFVSKFHKEFPTLPLNEIAITTGVNNMAKYSRTSSGEFAEKTPMHVRASHVYNEFITRNGLEKDYETIKEGEKIRYVFLKLPNPTNSDVFAWATEIPKELDISKYIDYEAIYTRTFYNPVEKIMGAFGYQVEEFVTLEDFMV